MYDCVKLAALKICDKKANMKLVKNKGPDLRDRTGLGLGLVLSDLSILILLILRTQFRFHSQATILA